MLYLDASLIVAALSAEPTTPRVQKWLAEHAADALVVSEWTVTEVSSALAIKVRTGHFDMRQRAEALALFSRWVADSFVVLPVTTSHFRTAARFVDRHELGLRAGDALHLATAADHGAAVHTLDRRLADAGPALDVPTHLLT